MKILCLWSPSAPHFVRSGWGHALSYCGHQFLFWNKEQNSAFDVFNDFEPDIFLGTTYDLDRSIIKNILLRPSLKVGLFCSAWGDFINHIPKYYPIVRVTDEEKRNVETLVDYKKLDFVFLHLTPKWIDSIIGGWKQVGAKPLGIMNAADPFVYYGGKKRKEYKSDISIISGYWPYKGHCLDRYLGPLNKFPIQYKLKIFGNGWNHLYSLGQLEEKDAKDVFASAKICPNISEPHSYLYNDLTERSFKVICAGGFCIHDNAVGIEEVYHKNEVPRFSDYDEFIYLIEKFIKNSKSLAQRRIRAFKNVMKNHTYFNRVAQMMEGFGLTEEKKIVENAHKNWLKVNEISTEIYINPNPFVKMNK